MKRKNISKRLMALLLCFSMTIGTPLTVLADEPSSESVTESVSESNSGSDTDSSSASDTGSDYAGSTESAPESVSEESTSQEPSVPETETPASTPDESSSATDSISAALSSTIGGSEKVIDDSYTDAEKYSTNSEDLGYDKNLCWAATAANMLWLAHYAQDAINPLTGDYFRNEDEVFDYFRQSFTDEVGVPDGAIEYFLNGVYKYQGVHGPSQLKDDAPDGGLRPDSIEGDDLKIVSSTEVDILDTLGNMVNLAAGALLKWWNGSSISGGHWLTIVGLESINNELTGIWLSDSDNDPATDYGYSSDDPEERASYAAQMPNSYTYYPVTLETIAGQDLWVIGDYLGNSSIKTLLTYLCILKANNTDTVPSSPSDSGSDPGEDVQYADIIPADPEEIADIIKQMMIDGDLSILSLTNGEFVRARDTEFHLFVRTSGTMLNNVYLDGNILRLDQYRIKNYSNGTFEIVLTGDVLNTLADGSHLFELEFSTGNIIETTITIR